MIAVLTAVWMRHHQHRWVIVINLQILSTNMCWWCGWLSAVVQSLARPHLCRFETHGPWPVWKQFSRDRVWIHSVMHDCWIAESVTKASLTTDANNHLSFSVQLYWQISILHVKMQAMEVVRVRCHVGPHCFSLIT